MPDHDPRPPWANQPTHAHGGWPGSVGHPGQHPQPGVGFTPYGPAPAHTQAPVDVRVVAAPAGGRGLALVGAVLGGAALLGVLLLGVALVAFVALSETGGSGWGPTQGTVAPSAGRSLDGPTLAAEISRQVTDEGGDPEGITCPATVKVAQDVTTVCHGEVDGDEWAFVVFFEDAEGRYTLLEV